MPFTPYHFGPNGFIGLVFKKWLDLPLLILANVIIDVEVLFYVRHTDGPLLRQHFPHQVFHFHTLLIGGLVGAALGLLLYPFRGIFKKLMSLIKLDYKPTLLKMVLSGVIGAWLHVTVDSIYHWDVQMFWPNTKWRPLWRIFDLQQSQIEYICIAFFFAAFSVYAILLSKKLKKEKMLEVQPQPQSTPENQDDKDIS